MKRIGSFLMVFLSFLYSSAQNGTEIYLFDMKINKGQVVLSNGINITNHKGYDNQPSFHPSQPLIYYASSNDTGPIDSSDIKIYNYQTKQTTRFAATPDREFSPTVTPDGQFISCILQRRNGDQDLVKYPIEGGKPKVLINHLKIGYHAWASENSVFLFVLDDSVNFSLHYYQLANDMDTVIAENVGRGLNKIPGQNAMSFVQKISDTLSVLKKYDLSTAAVSNIIYTVKGKDQLTWLQNNTILMSDGKQIFYHKVDPFIEFKDKKWKPVTMTGQIPKLKSITRLATNADNTKLAVVVGE
ncbi:MAG TPA: hypothetical protein VI385_06710 [Flavisolibacter sp.]